MNDNHSSKLANVPSTERPEITEQEHHTFISHMMCSILDSIYGVVNRSSLTFGEACVLCSIANGTVKKNYVSATNLASKYKLPKSTISNYLTRLISAGFVQETVDADDRRKRYLALTPQTIIAHGEVCDTLNKVRMDAYNAAGMPLTEPYTVK